MQIAECLNSRSYSWQHRNEMFDRCPFLFHIRGIPFSCVPYSNPRWQITVIAHSADLSKQCEQFAIPALCYTTFPPCKRKSRLRSGPTFICRSVGSPSYTVFRIKKKFFSSVMLFTKQSFILFFSCKHSLQNKANKDQFNLRKIGKVLFSISIEQACTSISLLSLAGLSVEGMSAKSWKTTFASWSTRLRSVIRWLACRSNCQSAESCRRSGHRPRRTAFELESPGLPSSKTVSIKPQIINDYMDT